METFFQKIKLIFHDSTLRKRILFVLGALMISRLLAAIPIPGVNEAGLQTLFSNNQFLGLLNIFSGGGLSNLSIVMLGLSPYITGSIIMQLLTMISPKLKALYHEEGELGRKKMSQYSRLLAVPLAIIQGYGFILLLQKSNVLAALTPFDFFVNVMIVTAGALLLMWIGELITEFGIGNGVSILIFAGIVAVLPQQISRLLFTFDVSQIPVYIAFLAVALVIIYSVVQVTEAERPVPITYAKRVRGNKVYGGISTYLPLRINQAGVIPIIFALSILLFPQMIFGFLSKVSNPMISDPSSVVSTFLQNSWVYGFLYFIFVFLFTYFYTAVSFDPEMISTNLQKSGAFIPGVRPGESTAQYLSKIVTRITFVGAMFLGFIAILPLIVKGISGIAS
ncbi:MAG: preprotein translocase subunit SecY, partial [Candidatus Paceibacterota bacterium]